MKKVDFQVNNQSQILFCKRSLIKISDFIEAMQKVNVLPTLLICINIMFVHKLDVKLLTGI